MTLLNCHFSPFFIFIEASTLPTFPNLDFAGGEGGGDDEASGSVSSDICSSKLASLMSDKANSMSAAEHLTTSNALGQQSLAPTSLSKEEFNKIYEGLDYVDDTFDIFNYIID